MKFWAVVSVALDSCISSIENFLVYIRNYSAFARNFVLMFSIQSLICRSKLSLQNDSQRFAKHLYTKHLNFWDAAQNNGSLDHPPNICTRRRKVACLIFVFSVPGKNIDVDGQCLWFFCYQFKSELHQRMDWTVNLRTAPGYIFFINTLTLWEVDEIKTMTFNAFTNLPENIYAAGILLPSILFQPLYRYV